MVSQVETRFFQLISVHRLTVSVRLMIGLEACYSPWLKCVSYVKDYMTRHIWIGDCPVDSLRLLRLL